MKESLLQLVWQQKLFDQKLLNTTKKESLIIHNYGVLNHLHGPDFSNAIIELDGQKWAGNIEIHVKSSDWYAHQHQKDENYKNVILHVVYEHDIDVFDVNGHEIPVLVLKDYISNNILDRHNRLLSHKKKWIFCEDNFNQINEFQLKHWLERLFVERLERKTNEVAKTHKELKGDWEATLFLLMAKCFGGNLNGSILYDAFSKVDFLIIKKQLVNGTTSSFLFGLVGLLNQEHEDSYFKELKGEFEFQKQKYQLTDLILPKLNFYGCRPSNFPTVRLAQFIAFYEKHPSIFSKILSLGSNIEGYKDLFEIKVNEYWQTHYNFEKESKKSLRKISKGFVDLLLINVVIPMLFLYYKINGLENAHLLELMYQLSPEKNSIINKFSQIGYPSRSALDTQALLTLKKEYCDQERCAECSIGVSLIKL